MKEKELKWITKDGRDMKLKEAKVRLELINTFNKMGPLKFKKLKGIEFPQWFLNLCEELPELKTYDCHNDLYDNLGEY